MFIQTIITISNLAHNLLEPSLIYPNDEHKPKRYAEGSTNLNSSASQLILSFFDVEYIPYKKTLALPLQHLVRLVHNTQHHPVGCPHHIFECMCLVTQETGPIMDKFLDCFFRYVELQVHLKKKKNIYYFKSFTRPEIQIIQITYHDFLPSPVS